MLIQIQMKESDARLALYALRKHFGLPDKKVYKIDNHLEPLIKLLVKTIIAEELKKDSEAATAALSDRK